MLLFHTRDAPLPALLRRGGLSRADCRWKLESCASATVCVDRRRGEKWSAELRVIGESDGLTGVWCRWLWPWPAGSGASAPVCAS
ncbi:unnamed protein product [Pleuronectes platessa]|uniref:Uncharacterized protein n=1 Tax=Pleuronectes platessa TaxID=8262 RepID=A0A9N7U3B6_PLEPL|nr:unnamed protein product [Pleuronectes platessa]